MGLKDFEVRGASLTPTLAIFKVANICLNLFNLTCITSLLLNFHWFTLTTSLGTKCDCLIVLCVVMHGCLSLNSYHHLLLVCVIPGAGLIITIEACMAGQRL